MSSVSLGESLLSNCCGFAAKQFFCITSGETVKRHLTPLISQIAKERIGAFFAFFFTSSTVPVLSATATCLMGDMLYWTVREIAQTLITLFKTLFFKAKGAVQTLPFKKELVYRIASYAVYFFSMTAWSYFAVGITHQALTFVFREIGKNRAMPFGLTDNLVAKIVSPIFTSFCGEVIGTILGVAVYNVCAATALRQ